MINLNAEDARELAKIYIDQTSMTQRLEIHKLIQKEASNGKLNTYYYGTLNEITWEYFEKLGYKIENKTNQQDGSSFKISW